MSAWDDLRTELAAQEAWYGGKMSVTGYIGIGTGSDYFGGAHVDGDPMESDYDEYLEASGKTQDECIADLIQKIRAYREERDRERLEFALDEGTLTPEETQSGIVVGVKRVLEGPMPALGRVVCYRCHRALQNVYVYGDRPFGRVCVQKEKSRA